MKDKAIFIVSLILVVAGVLYLGYTAYQFFTRGDQTNNEQIADSSNQTATTTSEEGLSLVGNSNKELLGNNLRQGDTVKVEAEIRNNSDKRISTIYEGRVYSIDELYTFPDVESEIPVNVESVPVAINANSASTYTYDYSVNECGNFYIALASSEYWKSGRGIVSYGYYTVNCDNSFVSEPTPRANETTKGGVTPTVTPSVTPEQVAQLPKAGPAEDAMLIGLVLFLLGVGYRIRIKA